MIGKLRVYGALKLHEPLIGGSLRLGSRELDTHTAGNMHMLGNSFTLIN